MSFSAAWLSLRAPADEVARDTDLLAAAAAWARTRPGVRILDLGSGTGATRRAFGDTVPGAQWWLADSDATLLAEAAALDVTPLVIDLAADLPRALAVGPDLVTASAFFDLAGAAWLDAFVDALAASGAAFYAALTYDGTETWRPGHPEDASVLAAFARDMQRDKGFGPALGGTAGAHLASRLAKAGYAVQMAQSPWRLTPPRDRALIEALAEGTARAARASADWLAARREASDVTVGHLDIWATPPQ
jgi:hypothetical protein